MALQLTAEAIYRLAPFARTLGVSIIELTPARVRVQLAVTRELSMLGGGLHCGAIMSVCDVASAVCAALNVSEGHTWSTADSTTYFLRPVRHTAVASALPVEIGASMITVKTEVHDGDKLCAYTTQMLRVTPVTG